MAKTRLAFPLAVLFGLIFGLAGAAEWPTKPITLQLGQSAGGSSDVMCRMIAPVLSRNLGQPVTVLNKPGAGGWIAWAELFTTMPDDGYTFGLVNTPGFTVGFYDEANPRPYTHRECALLINHVVDYCVLAIRNDETRFHDLASFIDYAGKNDVLAAASAVGILSDDYNIMKRLMLDHGITINVVQTGGAKETETFFVSGEVDVLFANVGDTRHAHENGEYKVIAIFAPERSRLLPDVPTCKELGFGDVFHFSARGYACPKGVPMAIQAKLVDALEKAILDPDVKDKLEALGFDTVIIKGEDYYKFMDQEVEETKRIYGIVDK